MRAWLLTPNATCNSNNNNKLPCQNTSNIRAELFLQASKLPSLALLNTVPAMDLTRTHPVSLGREAQTEKTSDSKPSDFVYVSVCVCVCGGGEKRGHTPAMCYIILKLSVHDFMREYLYVDVKNVHSKKMLPSFSILYHNVMLLCPCVCVCPCS